MEKLVYLLGDAHPGEVPRGRTDLRDALLGAAEKLAAAGARAASFTVADLDDAAADRTPQFNPSGLLDAQLSLWLDSLDVRDQVEAILASVTERVAGYLVTESVPLPCPTPPPRAGHRHPGVCLVTTFPKPEGLDEKTFYERWHDSHTPLSLKIHPLVGYVRNSVARPLTPGAPAMRAVVLESVESAEVVADPEAFFGSEANRKRAVEDLLSFVDFSTLNAVLMSEYTLSPALRTGEQDA